MKIRNTSLEQTTQARVSFDLSTSLRNQLNLLVLIHILFFISYCIIDWNGILSLSWADRTVDDQIHHSLAISSGAQDWPFNWTTSLFTYQFVHLNAGELLLSTSMLWLFGHILKKRTEQWRVIVFYFTSAFMSALVFNLSHLVFPIFSNPGGFMEGAFGGVLGVMTAAVLLYGSYQFRISKRISFYLWQVYFIALLLSLVMVYKNNIAYILVYAFNIYMGVSFVKLVEMREARVKPALS